MSDAEPNEPTVPVIETARLTLRGHRLTDFSGCAELWKDPKVTRYIGRQPRTAEQAWAKLLGYVGHWSLLGFGYWVAIETESGRFVGEVGLADFQREIEPPLTGKPEAGWALLPAFHGRGLATEAVAAVVAWADGNLDAAMTACLIDPENTASLGVAEKVGFREIMLTEYHGAPTLLFERPSAAPAD